MKKCCGGSAPSCSCRKKTIIFDLDGVLVDTLPIHFQTFNESIKQVIGENYIIPVDKYKQHLEGLSTNDKLKYIYDTNPEITLEQCEHIYYRKQELTIQEYSLLSPDNSILSLLDKLSKKFNLICCTNSNKKISSLLLDRIGVSKYFSYILSSDDIQNRKPYPEIYWKGMSLVGSYPHETLILEDSILGITGALISGCKVYRITKPGEISYDKIISHFKNTKKPMNVLYHDTLNVVIPMAGVGSRFKSAGFDLPKPLIDVDGRTMIRAVVDSINIQSNYIFLVLKEHIERYNIDKILKEIVPQCKVITVESITEGAASTILLGKEYIDNNHPILIVNSDNIILWDPVDFFTEMETSEYDGGIVYFEDTDPKWSFISVDDNNLITQVAEKEVISNYATAGIYYWKKGSDFVKYSQQMIQKNIRVNNEFYIAPVYNEAIQDGMHISPYRLEKDEMWGVGTPEDLDHYKNNFL